MQARIEQAFSDLREARINLHATSEQELEFRQGLKRREAELMMSGAIIGKNVESRDAQLREATKEEYDLCEKARQRKAQAQLQMDLAMVEVDEIEWLIRAQESYLSPNMSAGGEI